MGQAPKASEYYKLATTMPPDYVFPFQNEAIDVLRAAMKSNPRDARAPYYLGNLLYDWQPEEGANLNVSDQWTNAHILRGQQNIAAQRYREAFVDLRTAVTVTSPTDHRGSLICSVSPCSPPGQTTRGVIRSCSIAWTA